MQFKAITTIVMTGLLAIPAAQAICCYSGGCGGLARRTYNAEAYEARSLPQDSALATLDNLASRAPCCCFAGTTAQCAKVW